MDICEKLAYIKGILDCTPIDETKNEGKLLLAIVDLLEDITEEICDIEDACDDMSEQIDAVDEDLSDVEEIVYDEFECDDCDCEDCDDELYEIECPQCKDVIYLDEEMIEEGGIECPNCGTELEFDFDCDCDDCDCDECADKDENDK